MSCLPRPYCTFFFFPPALYVVGEGEREGASFCVHVQCIHSIQACSSSAWCLMTGAVFHTCLMAEGGEEEPEFSLITGGFVPTKETNQLEDGVFIIMS